MKITPSEIAQALKVSVPIELHGAIEDLANVLAQLINGNMSIQEAHVTTNSPEIKTVLENLEGTSFKTPTTVLSFGESNQTGDIRLGNVTGGHNIQVNQTIIHVSGQNSNATTKNENKQPYVQEHDTTTTLPIISPEPDSAERIATSRPTVYNPSRYYPVRTSRKTIPAYLVILLLLSISLLIIFLLETPSITTRLNSQVTGLQGQAVVVSDTIPEKATLVNQISQNTYELTYDIIIIAPESANFESVRELFTTEFMNKARREFGNNVIRYSSAPIAYVEEGPKIIERVGGNIKYRVKAASYVSIP